MQGSGPSAAGKERLWWGRAAGSEVWLSCTPGKLQLLQLFLLLATDLFFFSHSEATQL